MKRWFISLGVLVVIGACSRAAPPSSMSPDGAQSNGTFRAITGRVELAVSDVDDSVRALRGEIERRGGFVSNVEAREGEGRMEARIPAAQLEAFRSALAAHGRVNSSSERVEDVTAQHADLAARVHNARATEARLLELLEVKTGTLTDVVAVEKELSNARESIERMQAEQRVLDGRVAFATLEIELTHDAGPAWSSPMANLGHAAKTGVSTCGAVVMGALTGAIELGPTIGVIALFFLGARAAFRHIRLARAR